MSFALYWPIALIVLSNIFYHVCSKQTPEGVNPFASLTVTYLIGAVVSGVMFFALNPGGNLLREYKGLNWSAFVLGVAIVGLEAGSIYMYKAGWSMNTGQLLYSSILTVALLFIGYFFYHEAITWTKAVGVVICLIGLFFLTK